ncbi:protein-disulfide reductase DsbD domain-containing protein [Pseudogemmobacter sp. W21_MBD1_M6]|uniref:protein-disulfide reductase DsbD domain-containing protein n=1 Tax=Pseudogemmobacter sp. W21_MBD1_M6 TaxID=3240271 RepID=UPI003F95D1F5
MNTKFITSCALAASLFLASHAPALAKSGVLVIDDVVSVRILNGWRTDRGTHMAAIEVRLADGWKTYWRAPGDGGIPPRFNWSGSTNLANVDLHWPRPDAFHLNGMLSIGYHDAVIIPIELSPATKGQPISVSGEIDMGVCDDICVPVTVHVTAELPADQTTTDPAILGALKLAPANAKAGGVTSATCAVSPISDGMRVTATIDMPALDGEEIAVFELAGQQVWIDEAKTTRAGRHLTATTDVVPSASGPFLLNRSDLRITVLGKTRAVDIRGCPAG